MRNSDNPSKGSKTIDPAQKRRNSESVDSNTSLFCRLKYSDKQNYRIDKSLEDFHTMEELMQLTKCSRDRINSHITYIENNCPHAKREPPYKKTGQKFRFVLKEEREKALAEIARNEHERPNSISHTADSTAIRPNSSSQSKEERTMEPTNTKQNEPTSPLFIRIDNNLKARLLAQCERLNISQAAVTKMAIVRFLEEQENFQSINRK
jgi:hypothetical protein